VVAHQVLHDLAAYGVAPEKLSERRRHSRARGLRNELQCGVVREHERGQRRNCPIARRSTNPKKLESRATPKILRVIPAKIALHPAQAQRYPADRREGPRCGATPEGCTRAVLVVR